MHITRLLLFVTTITCVCGERLERRSHNGVKKRSLPLSATKKNDIAIDSAVDDITDSTAFADREKKWNALIKGELFPEHMEKKASKKFKLRNENDSDDDNGEKKDRIENRNLETGKVFSETLAADDYDDSNSENAEDDTSESASGSAELEGTAGVDGASEDGAKSEDNTGERRQEKVQCHRKCSMPMTYHECAHPRCNLKMGTIKDLCFYLCKHQKERCEDVCD